jgi:hypothetical protein
MRQPAGGFLMMIVPLLNDRQRILAWLAYWFSQVVALAAFSQNSKSRGSAGFAHAQLTQGAVGLVLLQNYL